MVGICGATDLKEIMSHRENFPIAQPPRRVSAPPPPYIDSSATQGAQHAASQDLFPVTTKTQTMTQRIQVQFQPHLYQSEEEAVKQRERRKRKQKRTPKKIKHTAEVMLFVYTKRLAVLDPLLPKFSQDLLSLPTFATTPQTN